MSEYKGLPKAVRSMIPEAEFNGSAFARTAAVRRMTPYQLAGSTYLQSTALKGVPDTAIVPHGKTMVRIAREFASQCRSDFKGVPAMASQGTYFLMDNVGQLQEGPYGVECDGDVTIQVAANMRTIPGGIESGGLLKLSDLGALTTIGGKVMRGKSILIEAVPHLKALPPVMYSGGNVEIVGGTSLLSVPIAGDIRGNFVVHDATNMHASALIALVRAKKQGIIKGHLSIEIDGKDVIERTLVRVLARGQFEPRLLGGNIARRVVDL